MNPADIALPSGAGSVRVRWLGTAGFAIEHQGAVVLIDPYLTRAPLWRCLTQPLLPDHALLERELPRADAIVVGHTHFDHALDTPSIARRTGALVFGSGSCATLCASQGVPAAQLREPRECEVGPFRLRFFASAHSRFLFGTVPFPGEIADCDQVPLRAHRYRCGAVFGVEIEVSGKRIVHLGSAELVDAHAPRREADLLLLCTAGWQSSRDLPQRAARAFSPRTVLLSHWDDFLAPLGRPARALPGMQMARLVDRLGAATREARIGTLPLLGELFL
jgi:L-ascorbate metabolism protein UlaG (beta-lactamase superfamily)